MPQQDRAHATREAILRAAAEEFDRLGYERTSLKGVLGHSGLTKGAFYFHFASKEALAAALVSGQDDLWARMREDWDGRALDPLRRLVGMFHEAAERMAADVTLRAGVRLAADREVGYPGLPSAHLEWEKIIEAYLVDARDAGNLRDGADPAALARTLCAATLGARFISSATTRCADFPARTREILRYVLSSVISDDWLLAGPEVL
ncbi:TetR family transcriptional regulator [Lentzea sp. NBRC 105346]|uniref:ScbR family autoregulator-binding transcription factor n=1 Tax=Lentzea sp. NBRC 105346 TaxID=3032205 RepID=UPI0024A5315B|nr:ScbR family autoregulator-binding transcription factor [Lentzea sp. NBRC 105346]GLZ31381.1 TetR family transcriptional regulator [Lentzea sp. NBRC 105346]